MKRWVVLFTFAVVCSGGAQQEARVISGQQCLAPLVWEARKGTRPLAFEEAFFDGPFRAPLWPENATPFPFSVTTSSEEAQAWFDRGIYFLHGLDEAKAEAAFRQSISLDSDLAMGYWGLALSNLDHRRRATTFIAKAQSAIDNESAFEREVIGFWNQFIRESEGTPADRQVLAAGLESSYLKSKGAPPSGPLFGEHLYSGVLLLRQILLNEIRGGVPIQNRSGVAALLGELESLAPRYPLETYRALLWQSDHQEQFFRSLKASMNSDKPFDLAETPDTLSLIAGVSQSSYHWRGAADTLTDAVRLDLSQIVKTGEMPDGGQNLGPNAAALIRNLAGRGQTDIAIALARQLVALPSNPYAAETVYRRVSRDERLWSAVRDAWMEALVQGERWTEVADLPEGFEPADRVRYFVWRAIAARQLGDEGKPQLHLAQARNATKQEESVIDASTAYLDWVSGENFETLPRIPGVPLYHLANMVLDHGHPDIAFQILRLDREAQFASKVAKVETQIALEDPKKALKQIDDQFRTAAAAVAKDNPLMRRLKKIKETLQIDLPVSPTSIDVPELAFSMRQAPALERPNHTGELVSLENYRGKPVVVIFFLGGSCLHCVQQLNAFIPWVERYREAGIDLVTVSTDDVENLDFTLSEEAKTGYAAFPFQILSDEKLDSFKDFGVYDEFENRPMHGTFLLDGTGEILWQELGHEPFMRADFLLEEAQRLVK